ncbi:MAG TPA: phosphate ABC transporter permease subunit PstC [Acidimicrobiia bacterium]|nr:phosphate ABC transporter permease subunit PstC [Acidimicrobiia bacterium]
MISGPGELAVMDVDDVPTTPQVHPTTGDRIFRGLSTAAASVSLIIVGATLVFLILRSRPAFRSSGIIDFFTKSVWNPDTGHFGVLGLLEGTLVIAAIAMVIAVPLGVAMALFINEYASPRLRGPLTSTVDLLAALPSLLFGIWGLLALQSHLTPVASFLGHHFSAVPFLRIRLGDGLVQSSFIAGCVVAIMILPIITSVTRDVMAQVPREQCEGALALGGTRWGMIREVILPFARGGIVGASLLGFGRALGETIAVALLISPQIDFNSHIFKTGGASVAAYIAIHFGEAGPLERSGLVAAGLALFLLTLAVNLGARFIVVRKTVK